MTTPDTHPTTIPADPASHLTDHTAHDPTDHHDADHRDADHRDRDLTDGPASDLTALNRDIWTPFTAAYAARDATAFLATHHRDLVRASGQTRRIDTFASYADEITAWFADMTARGTGLAIGFRFTERFATGDLACERGVFRITVSPTDGPTQVFFGRFHTLARRDDGRWRILTDYDSSERGTVDAAAYAAATAAADLDPFA